jgi:hypothetical protein
MFDQCVCFLWIGNYASAPGSFLFSLRNNDDLDPFKAPLQQEDDDTAIHRHDNYGPCFGDDLCIGNNALTTGSSWTDFGYTYQPPTGYTHGLPKTTNLLTGSKYKFSPSEVEVLYLN